MNEEEVPEWLRCECGCGKHVLIATRTRTERGWIKGQPLRFASKRCANRVAGLEAKGHEGGEKHPSWKGDVVGYRWLHQWLQKNYPKKHKCEACSFEGRTEYALVGASYTRDREDYIELCGSCHRRMDSVINRLLNK